MGKKLHNPKAHAPAVYIPCWLIQVPNKLLSHAAKILYGRLAQWSNTKGKVYRSVPQLSQETGTEKRQIDRYIKELKDVGLIGTFHPQKGGVNHFEFYDHEWMNAPIKDELSYEDDPTTNMSLPHDKNVVTPTTNMSSINIKEIKRNKDINNIGISDETPITKTKIPKSSNLAKTKGFTIEKMLEDNPHDLPQQALEDWQQVRAKKRAVITKTAWDDLNNELDKLNKAGLDPKACFKSAVGSGWQSLKSEWFLTNAKAGQENKTIWDIESVMRA